MGKFHFMYLKELYTSKAHRALVDATFAMEPKPVYANVYHVPAMIESVKERGSNQEAAEEVLQAYFSMSDADRDLAYSR